MKLQKIKIAQQNEIFQVMARPEFYPHPVTEIEERETHISKVFLTGNFVYKIKKAVDLEFLDYTSLSKRKYYCEQETVLNRRLSNNIYMGVVAITLRDGRYYLDGPGKTVEYGVKMHQIPEQCSMLQLLRQGKVGGDIIEQLALKLANFYCQTPTGEKINSYGSLKAIRETCEENFNQTERFAGSIIDTDVFTSIREATLSFLYRSKTLFMQRIETGKIRDCHGDLRCGHIYLTDIIQIIDCIEFNDRFRYSDIISDLAFLIMDLEHEGFYEIGHSLLDCYVQYAEDPDAFVLANFYKCYRALVRTKVNCLRLEECGEGQFEKNSLYRETGQYLNLAYQYSILFTRPTIWVICGMVATGKSTIATELSRKLGVGVLRSDLIRKDLFGVRPYEFIDATFEGGLYTKEASALTYGKLLLLAKQEIEKGVSVVLDATFSTKKTRREALSLANDREANIIFVECISPDKTVVDRLLKREGGATISDARRHHFKKFKSRFEPLEEVTEAIHVRIDTQLSIKKNMVEILSGQYKQL